LEAFETWYEDSDIAVGVEWVRHVEGWMLPFAHLQVKRWTAGVGKKVIACLYELRADLRERGHKFLFAYNLRQDAQWFKFMEKFLRFNWGFIHDSKVVYWTKT
jgi:hypothetical protein